MRQDRADPGTRLRTAFTWLGGRTDEHRYAEVAGWWRDPALLRDVGASLADLFRAEQPTVVVGIEAHGFILGPLVAVNLDVGFVEVRKDPLVAIDSDQWLRRAAPPDYRDRNLMLGTRRGLIGWLCLCVP